MWTQTLHPHASTASAQQSVSHRLPGRACCQGMLGRRWRLPVRSRSGAAWAPQERRPLASSHRSWREARPRDHCRFHKPASRVHGSAQHSVSFSESCTPRGCAHGLRLTAAAPSSRRGAHRTALHWSGTCRAGTCDASRKCVMMLMGSRVSRPSTLRTPADRVKGSTLVPVPVGSS